jgi:hypothetical protein
MSLEREKTPWTASRSSEQKKLRKSSKLSVPVKNLPLGRLALMPRSFGALPCTTMYLPPVILAHNSSRTDMGRNNADFEQRPRSLTAQEILSTHSLGDHSPEANEDITGKKPPKTKSGFISRRLNYVWDNNPELVRSIRESGVKEPVTVSWNKGNPTLIDGHDRVIISKHLRPQDPIRIDYVD